MGHAKQKLRVHRGKVGAVIWTVWHSERCRKEKLPETCRPQCVWRLATVLKMRIVAMRDSGSK